MTAYFLTLFGAALAVALVDLLVPERGRKTVRLISALFLLCVLSAPLPRAFRAVRDYTLPDAADDAREEYSRRLEEAMQSASRTYFAKTLCDLICEQFSLPEETVRCAVEWKTGEPATPERITVILSGGAIWKDPEKLEAFVRDLIGCDCVTAIE
ncbi:MAG: hypothetical protein SOZ51_03980 [Eubacteriales bacterium]|nr:hypothetical protein [Eubacteriales bacterium]